MTKTSVHVAALQVLAEVLEAALVVVQVAAAVASVDLARSDNHGFMMPLCTASLMRLIEPQLYQHLHAKFEDEDPDDVDEKLGELLKFLYLASSHACLRGTFIPVTQQVDEIWHELILQTKLYLQLCNSLPGKVFIHHESMTYSSYAKKRDKESVVREVLLWLSAYVGTFGPFQEGLLKHWYFLRTVRDTFALSLEDLNSYALRRSEGHDEAFS